MADPTPSLSTEFRRMMARWATGVSVVTARGAGGDVGLTVNALLSVTLDPPTLLISLTDSADSTPVIEAAGHFAASFLAAGQRPLSERFAQTLPSPEKFRDVATHRGTTGAPLLTGALGSVECRVVNVFAVRDHHLIVGEVVAIHPGADGLPLLFYHRGYASASGASAVNLPPPGG
ncbi:MAG TPA: flavin reductase family protein [Thermoplasmata archaeon]|nr:flavin reductase family protein [Thermoplasmata archaeon]